MLPNERDSPAPINAAALCSACVSRVPFNIFFAHLQTHLAEFQLLHCNECYKYLMSEADVHQHLECFGKEAARSPSMTADVCEECGYRASGAKVLSNHNIWSHPASFHIMRRVKTEPCDSYNLTPAVVVAPENSKRATSAPTPPVENFNGESTTCVTIDACNASKKGSSQEKMSCKNIAGFPEGGKRKLEEISSNDGTNSPTTEPSAKIMKLPKPSTPASEKGDCQNGVATEKSEIAETQQSSDENAQILGVLEKLSQAAHLITSAVDDIKAFM